jgi:di/tricarboxylate transporter
MPLEPHALWAIFLTLGALFLFSRERIPLEYSCAAVLTILVISLELFPVPGPAPVRGARFLEGFGNEALITICLLLVLAKGVEISGALRPIGVFLVRVWLANRFLALLATLTLVAGISAFANNTPIVVMMLPILVGVAHRTGISPSKMLMPVGFATILGGMCTTIGTSTNLLVVSISEDYGLQRLQMFDFFVPAVAAAAIGIIYLWLLAPHLLPARPSLLAGSAPRLFDATIVLDQNSPLAGSTLASIMRQLSNEVRVTRVERNSSLELARLPTLTLQPGDTLYIRGTPEAIHSAQAAFGDSNRLGSALHARDERLVEIVVTRDSNLDGKRLGQATQGALQGLYPIGWYRPGQRSITPLDQSSDPLLQTGDVLLMQGPRQDIQALIDSPRLLILARTIHVPRTHRAPFAMVIMVGVIAVAALGFLPLVACALFGVGMMIAGRCLSWNEAWAAIDTRLALVIVTSLGLGSALTATGAADYLAQALVGLISGLPPPVVLSGLLLTTALLTEVVTNNAVAVIATPIAMSIAAELAVPALPFVLAVLFGANMSYLTPIGYQTNLLVLSAGGYQFSDFFRAGLPLQVIMWLALSFIIPAMYL